MVLFFISSKLRICFIYDVFNACKSFFSRVVSRNLPFNSFISFVNDKHSLEVVLIISTLSTYLCSNCSNVFSYVILSFDIRYVFSLNCIISASILFLYKSNSFCNSSYVSFNSILFFCSSIKFSFNLLNSFVKLFNVFFCAFVCNKYTRSFNFTSFN